MTYLTLLFATYMIFHKLVDFQTYYRYFNIYLFILAGILLVYGVLKALKRI